MIVTEPYFMQNTAWYYFDEDEFLYKLTDEAPEEAKMSYQEFYRDVYNGDPDNGSQDNR